MFVAQIMLPTALKRLPGTSMLTGVCRMWPGVWWVDWTGVFNVFAHRFQREPSGVVEGNQGKLVCCQSAQTVSIWRGLLMLCENLGVLWTQKS